MTRPYFHFWTITLVNVNGFSPNLVCALIFWTFALGLLTGKFHQFLTALSVCEMIMLGFIFSHFIPFNIQPKSPGPGCSKHC